MPRPAKAASSAPGSRMSPATTSGAPSPIAAIRAGVSSPAFEKSSRMTTRWPAAISSATTCEPM